MTLAHHLAQAAPTTGPARHPRTRRDRQRGTASLELVAGLPFLLLAGVVAAQFGLVGWTAISASDAARAAARAASLGQNPHAAAQDALPQGISLVSVSGGKSGQGYSYTVTVATPAIVPILDLGNLSRQADMPAYR